MERTYVMIKPDGVKRGLVGEILVRFEKKGIKVVGLKLMQISRETAENHYGEHKERSFFGPLVDYITSGPVAAMVLEGKNVVKIAREMMGATNPAEASPGSIRATYAMEIGRNVIHGSDSAASAEREISIFFKSAELVDYNMPEEALIYE
jgi:nucleoside-diphosphate kinase